MKGRKGSNSDTKGRKGSTSDRKQRKGFNSDAKARKGSTSDTKGRKLNYSQARLRPAEPRMLRNRPPQSTRERPNARPPKQTRQDRSISLKAFAISFTLVLGLLGISQPLHQWWSYTREYNAIRHQIEEAKKTNNDLQEDLDRWGDKAYVASQARARLYFVQPGETQFQVVDAPGGQEGMSSVEPVQQQGPPRPWYLVLVDTVDAADDPDPIVTPEPSVLSSEGEQ